MYVLVCVCACVYTTYVVVNAPDNSVLRLTMAYAHKLQELLPHGELSGCLKPFIHIQP